MKMQGKTVFMTASSDGVGRYVAAQVAAAGAGAAWIDRGAEGIRTSKS
jgi:NAD(P)-dependent dehydrogenase (short-subunit alcohol dehydrogenase family)